MITTKLQRSLFYRLHIDHWLLLAIFLLMIGSLSILYSIGGVSLLISQIIRFSLALAVMFFLAQIPPREFERWTPILFLLGVSLLVAVMFFGHTGKGAQRWLDLGFTKFQPSELMKLAMPFMVAFYLNQAPLPPTLKTIFVSLLLILVPTLLIAQQPDLGTAIIIATSGIFVLFLGGVSWIYIGIAVTAVLAFIPIFWRYFMHDYQRTRVLTLLDPESDPLGAGYHIIQSKIAIGSGGFFGKGWMQGTQSQLEFLPERHTDFIFSVLAEEFGFVGVVSLFLIYFLIILRGLWIANQAQDGFEKLVAGSISLTFFIYVFVNIGMVSGLLPVVGVPLPLISFGGTSMVTLLAGFGILMSIHTNKRFNSRN